MADNYMADQNVRKYYDMWKRSPTNHPADRANFYRFVKACVDFAGHQDLVRNLGIDILKASLYDDFRDQYSADDLWDTWKSKTVGLFETLVDYEDTSFPSEYR